MGTIDERCVRAVRARETGRAAAALVEAIGAAERADGGGVATALAPLGEGERFVAVVGTGLLFPACSRAAAEALDAALPRDAKVVSWTDFCDADLAGAWAVAVADVVPTAVVASILARAYYGTRALVTAVRHAATRDRVDDARALAAAVNIYQKSDRAAALVTVALAPSVRAVSVDDPIARAIDAASCKPIIETGGEEVEALAGVLAIVVDHALLPADHALVADLVKRLKDLREVQVEQRDQKSWGYLQATRAAARGATAARPGWLDVAERTGALVWDSRCEGERDAALEEARARIAGGGAAAAPPPAPSPEADDADALGALATQADFKRRSVDATAWMARCLARGDAATARRALALAVAPSTSALPAAEAIALRAAVLGALASFGGEAAQAASVRGFLELLGELRDGAPDAVWEAIERALAPAAGLRDARKAVSALVEGAIEIGLASAFVDRLGRLVAPLDDAALEERLLSACSAGVAHDPDDEASHAKEVWRERRCGRAVTAIAARLSPAAVEARLPMWRRAAQIELPPDLAPWLPSWSLDDVTKRLGKLERGALPPLGAAWAKHGRLDDAIALAATGTPSEQAATLVAIAEAGLDAAALAKLIRTFEKCPKSGRGRDEQAMWKWRRATIRLLSGRFDEAIAALAAMSDCRISGFGPGDFAISLVNAAEARGAWTPELRGQLADALAASGVIPQDLPRPALVVLAAARDQVGEATLAKLRARFGKPGDAAVVDAGHAIGLSRAGRLDEARAALEAALAAAERGPSYFTKAHHLVEAARAVAATSSDANDERAAAAWRRSVALAARESARDAERVLAWVIEDLTRAEVPMLRAVLAEPSMPAAVAEAARSRLCEALATKLDDGAATIAELVEEAPDGVIARRRAGWAAVALARASDALASLSLLDAVA